MLTPHRLPEYAVYCQQVLNFANVAHNYTPAVTVLYSTVSSKKWTLTCYVSRSRFTNKLWTACISTIRTVQYLTLVGNTVWFNTKNYIIYIYCYSIVSTLLNKVGMHTTRIRLSKLTHLTNFLSNLESSHHSTLHVSVKGILTPTP